MAIPIPIAAAPWRSAFLEHIQTMSSPTFYLSTIQPPAAPASRSSASGFSRHFPSEPIPRVRTVVFRGMWASLPTNPKNTAELNPRVLTSDMPVITTDVRMEKVPQLKDTCSLGSREDWEGPQSAVGGPYEACFWFEEPRTQWRIRGYTCIIAQDIESDAAGFVRALLSANMRAAEDADVHGQGGPSGAGREAEEDSSWSWSRELTAHFGNLSPLMRGSFKNPQPGGDLSREPAPRSGLGLGQRVTDNHDEIARRNFRVVVLVPEEVERVDLSDPERGRRWRYMLHDDNSWHTEELWP